MGRPDLRPLACALAAFVAAGLCVAVSLHWQSWDTTSLVRMHDTLPIAKLALHDDPGFRLRHDSGFYDGAFFYAIARDPLATGDAHHLLKEAPYYWGHPGYGWLTWLASGGGRPGAVPDALLAVGLLSILLAGAAASVLAAAIGWTAWGGLVVAINPGLLFAVANDTSEALGAVLLLGGLAAYARGRRLAALALLAGLCLVKEPLVLVPLAIAAWELWRSRRVPVVGFAVVPAALWWIYLRVHLGAFPFGHGTERLTTPFAGWKNGLIDAAHQSWNPAIDTAQLGQAAVPLIAAVFVAVVVGAVGALWLRTPVEPAYLAVAALYACISANGVNYPKDLIRELALVLVMLPFVLAGSARRRLRARPPFAPPRES